MPSPQVPDHVMLTTVVLDDLRLAYVPVPKAASTTILLALSELAGVRTEDLAQSHKLEVTRALTIHDGSLWPPASRLTAIGADEVETILRSDEWFRFTVVREPARRIWSAWVSKVLVRSPRFVRTYDDDLFPPPPSSASGVLESFRRFVSSLPERPDWDDPHWSPQADLLGIPGITYSHIGRVEAFDRTIHEVSTYIRRRGTAPPTLEAENRSFLRFSPGLFDRDSHDAYLRWTERDRAAFGYEPLPFVEDEPDDRWYARVEATIPAIRTLVDQNQRFLDVWQLLDNDGEKRDARPKPRHRAAARRVTTAGPFRGVRGSGVALRVLVAAFAVLALLVLLPELFGDRPYDPRPSAWPAEIEHP